MAMGYIDREEAMRAIDEYKGYFQDQVSTSNLLTKIEAKCIINDVDDADVEPVVRCRDCKHYVKGSCNAHSVWPDEYSTGYDCRPDDDDFCSYGERKEE